MPSRARDDLYSFSGTDDDDLQGAFSAVACEVKEPVRRRAVRKRGFAPRQRIDLKVHRPLVLHRVESAAESLGVRCGTKLVLDAVLYLVVGKWKRISDDQVRVAQILEHFPRGVKRLSPRTVTRNLARLHALELIVYRPAQGRGCRAEICIHPRFLADIDVLKRDENGKVIPRQASQEELENVPFSRALTISSQVITSLPSTERSVGTSPDSRPVEVNVEPKALQRVLHQMPECMRALPTRIRWKLGALISAKLRRGWREEQILAILAADLPAALQRPYKLAEWRLAHNMSGPGPRLAKLQQGWDRNQTVSQRRNHQDRQDDAFDQIRAQLTKGRLDALARVSMRTAVGRFGADAIQTARNEVGAESQHQSMVLSAARIAQRQHPDLELTGAVDAWLAEQQPDSSVFDDSAERQDQWWLTAGGGCINCSCPDAPTRRELPLPAPMCQDCFGDFLEECGDDLGISPEGLAVAS